MTGTLTSPLTGARLNMVAREYDEEASMLGLSGAEQYIILTREDGKPVEFMREAAILDREGEVTKVIYRSASGHKLTVWND